MQQKEIITELFADYFQFYLQDETVSGDLSDSWTDEAVDRLLAVADGTIGVGTVRNMDVGVILKVYDSELALINTSQTIHQINECDLEMISENLVIAGCTDYFPDAMRVRIGKGIFRARIYFKNLDSISEDGFDGDDRYEVHLWPSNEKSGVQIVKSRNKSI